MLNNTSSTFTLLNDANLNISFWVTVIVRPRSRVGRCAEEICDRICAGVRNCRLSSDLRWNRNDDRRRRVQRNMFNRFKGAGIVVTCLVHPCRILQTSGILPGIHVIPVHDFKDLLIDSFTSVNEKKNHIFRVCSPCVLQNFRCLVCVNAFGKDIDHPVKRKVGIPPVWSFEYHPV